MALAIPQDWCEFEGFLSEEECKKLIFRAEDVGFTGATIDSSAGPNINLDVRNNFRVTIDEPELAADIWRRLETRIPCFAPDWKPIGVNERIRYYRYEVGQVFKWHRDGYFRRNDKERSAATFMIYLNSEFEGGQTEFGGFNVAPATGKALCFRHGLPHQGGVVTQGRKYVLRSDIMYQLPS